MKRAIAIGATLALLVPVLVRLLLAQSPAPPPSQAPPPPSYTLTDFGPLNVTAASSGATALNASGQITGFGRENFATSICLARDADRVQLEVRSKFRAGGGGRGVFSGNFRTC
jgi:hypothetical protein